MIKTIVFLPVLLFLGLTACGGGSSGGSAPSTSTIIPSLTSSNASNLSASAGSSSFGQSNSSQNSSTRPDISTLVSVSNKPLITPVFQITSVPLSVQKNENFDVQWVAYSAEGALKNVRWTQTSGPQVVINAGENNVNITAGDVGNIVLDGSVTDGKGITETQKIAFTVVAPISPKARLLQGSSSGKGIDLVIVGDGFLAEDQKRLERATQDVMRYMFDYDNKALMRYKSLFNVWLIESISTTRDISVNGGEGPTLFGAYFGCGNIDRLLCVNDQKVIDLVVQHVPQYDQVLVLVNSQTYGGAGGYVATASLNFAAKNVVLHELGHSLVHLADEYSDGDISRAIVEEPAQVNVTVNSNPLTVKWNYWFRDENSIPGFSRYNYSNDEVGFFLGGNYANTGIWRPTFESIMRVINGPFGNVNREAWALSLWNYSSNATGFLPASNEVAVTNQPLIFSVPSTIDITDMRISWWINDVKVESASSSQFLVLTAIDETIHSVKVTVEDNTGFIRRDVKGVSKLQNTWSIR